MWKNKELFFRFPYLLISLVQFFFSFVLLLQFTSTCNHFCAALQSLLAIELGCFLQMNDVLIGLTALA